MAGKGGVGKTTATASLAVAAARLGLSVLVVDVEGRSSAGRLLGAEDVTHDATIVARPGATGADGRVSVRSLSPDTALVEYLEGHGLARVARRMVRTGVVDIVANAAPGMHDILLLGKIKQIEQAGEADVILVDAPASGHAISFLNAPRGLLDAVRVGPIRTQALAALDLLSDPVRCQVLLVTLAEETPVNEVVETAFRLEDEVGIKLGPVIVNNVDPAPGLDDLDVDAILTRAAVGDEERRLVAAAAHHRRDRAALQGRHLERLATELPLPQLLVSRRINGEVGPGDLDDVAAELTAGIEALEPAAVRAS